MSSNVTLQTFPLKKRNQFIVEYIHYICERFSTEMSTLLSIICLDSYFMTRLSSARVRKFTSKNECSSCDSINHI